MGRPVAPLSPAPLNLALVIIIKKELEEHRHCRGRVCKLDTKILGCNIDSNILDTLGKKACVFSDHILKQEIDIGTDAIEDTILLSPRLLMVVWLHPIEMFNPGNVPVGIPASPIGRTSTLFTRFVP